LKSQTLGCAAGVGHQRSVEVCRRTSAKADTESRCTTVPPQALFPAM